MGMFDTVYFSCECGEELYDQSKAGDCTLAAYGISELPAEIAKDLHGETYECGSCGKTTTLIIAPRQQMTVEMIAHTSR